MVEFREIFKQLSPKNQRLLACDCAERALRREIKPDKRSWEAIRVSRRYAMGQASDDELHKIEGALAMSRLRGKPKAKCPVCGDEVRKKWMFLHFEKNHPIEYQRMGCPRYWYLIKIYYEEQENEVE